MLFLRNLNDEHMRYVTRREGEELVAGDQASHVYKPRQHGKEKELIGYRLRVLVKPSAPGVATLKKSEMQANAGVYGRSYTVNLDELDKREHMRTVRYQDGVEVQFQESEDFIELAQGKVTLWALERDTKAVRVGPKPDAAAIRLAADLAYERRLYPD